jgi:hypothetical protein
MKKLMVSIMFFLSFLSFTNLFAPVFVSAEACSQSSFFGLPTWYKYLETEKVQDNLTGGFTCNVKIEGIGDVWLVVAAIIDIMLRLAALLAVGFIIYGGVLYILSQSQPEKTKQALMTVINAVIGLVIAIIATGVITFVAGSFN